MAWVVQLNFYDPVAMAETSTLFSMGPGIAFTDAVWAAPGLTKWLGPTQKLSIDTNGVISESTDQGEIDITDMPSDISLAGRFDSLENVIFHGRLAYLFWLPGTPGPNSAMTWASRILMDIGMLEQPVINFTLGTTVASYFAFILRDPRSNLGANLQPTLYGGTNVLPYGVDGTPADLQGKPKPIMYGRVSNIPGVRVNTPLLIYQLADVVVAVDCVRDGGLSLNLGTVRGSLALLQTASTVAGTYDTYAGSEGTFVRLGSTPQFSLTFDAYEGVTAALRTPAQIWSRMRVERCGNVTSDIDTPSVATADALDSGESGVWFSDQTTQLDALNQVLSGFSGFEVFSTAATWKIYKLTVPTSGTTTIVDMALLNQSSIKLAKTRDLAAIQYVRPDYTSDGCIPWQVNVQWGFNYTVMATSDFAGATIQRLKDKFSLDWRSTAASNTSTWNPATLTGPWKNAPSFTMNSNYQAQSDGTCPAAVTEAARLLAMYGVQRSQWQVSFRPEPGDRVLPGDVVSMTIPQYGLAGGGLFRVLQSGLLVDETGCTMQLIIGLQRLSTDP